MIIKQIKLNNFRQFKGEHTIEFSTDKEKNVSVILGSNTSGKTTIVGAFIWCLYGRNELKAPNSLLNSIIANSLTPSSFQEVSVEITLNHDNRDYIILRTIRYQKTFTGDSVRAGQSELKVSYLDESGQTIPINPSDCQDVINSILPVDLSDYFFFDGERIKGINTKNNVLSAVRGLMGLDVYSAAIDHLSPTKPNSVIGKLKKELDTGKDQEAERRKYEIQALKEKLEGFEKRKPQLEDEITHWSAKKDEYAAIIRDNQDVKKDQIEKEKLEREVDYYTKAISQNEEKFLAQFNNNACMFFAIPLIKRAMNVINSAKDECVGIPHMDGRAIDFIIKRGKCICGCDLTKNQGAVEYIEHEKKLLPPLQIGTLVRVFKEKMENALVASRMYADNVNDYYNNWLDCQRQLEYKTKDLKSISEKIKGYSDVKKIEEKYQEACQQLEKYETSIRGNRDSIVELNARISENEKEIDKLYVANEKNKKIKRYCDYAEAIYDWFKQYYDEQEKSVKEELLASINENFTKMYHGSREIIMDNNYKITPVLTGDKSELGKSEGLETVTNFSFILGLVELARKRTNEADDSDENKQKVTEPYPIVMDAPFSNTDIKHIENITARLPEVAEQVIIFVMDKDWNYARKKLEPRLGSKYVIEKVDNKDNYSVLRREI